MKNKTLVLIFSAAVLIFSGCAKIIGDQDGSMKNVPLVLSVEESVFPKSASCDIGVFLSNGRSNVLFTKPAGDNRCTTEKPLLLDDADEVLLAYYPYDPDMDGLESFKIFSSINGTDYRFADPVKGISSANPDVTLTMNHALCLISLEFIKEKEYDGDGVMTYLSFSSGFIAPAGDLNLADGSISTASGPVSFSNFSHVITVSGITENVMLVPAVTTGKESSIEMKCVIDGTEYVARIPVPDNLNSTIKRGARAFASVKVNKKSLTVSSVTVSEWNSQAGSHSESGAEDSGLYSVTADQGQYGGSFEL